MRRALGVGVACALSACGGPAPSPSPHEPQGPPSSMLSYVPEVPAPPPNPPGRLDTVPVPTVPPAFVRTERSDEWVARTIKLQARPERVIAVGFDERTLEVAVPTPSLDARPDPARDRPVEKLDITMRARTLQEAVDQSRGGDVIAIAPGRYAGFLVGKRPNTGDGRYVRIVATGRPFEVVIDRAGRESPEWMVELRTAQYVTLEGLTLEGSSEPGRPDSDAPRAGCFVDGNFRRSGELAHHVVLTRIFSHHHRKWGFHSTDSRTVLIQDSVFAMSGQEHGAYVSDGSDDYVIRRNVFFGNHAAGLQVNLDPHASLEELGAHPRMRDVPPGSSRSWAARMLARGDELFGPGQFPDGRGVNFLIEDNVANENGTAGAGAFNFAAMSHSLVQNNLLYGNRAHGIAQWDDGNDFDRPSREPGPRTVEEARDLTSLPLFGCQHNVIRGNTVIMARAGRAAMQSGNGSFGTRVYNNLLLNDAGPSIEVLATSVLGFDAGPNVVGAVVFEGVPDALLAAATRLPAAGGTRTGYTEATIAPELRRPGHEPLLTLSGGGFRLNPARPDFRPRAASPVLVGIADERELPAQDASGHPRTARAVGAFSP